MPDPTLLLTIIGAAGAGISALIAAFGIPAYISLKKEARENKEFFDIELLKCEAKSELLTRRVEHLEAKEHHPLVEWRKNQQGVYLTVNAEYVKAILLPLNMNGSDVLGKRDEDIEQFGPALREALKGLDDQARQRGAAAGHGICFHDRARPMTVIKHVMVDRYGVISFLGLACFEE